MSLVQHSGLWPTPRVPRSGMGYREGKHPGLWGGRGGEAQPRAPPRLQDRGTKGLSLWQRCSHRREGLSHDAGAQPQTPACWDGGDSQESQRYGNLFTKETFHQSCPGPTPWLRLSLEGDLPPHSPCLQSPPSGEPGPKAPFQQHPSPLSVRMGWGPLIPRGTPGSRAALKFKNFKSAPRNE